MLVIWKELEVAPLLLLIERNQLRWFWLLVRMPPVVGVPDMPKGKAVPGMTQDTLERLYLLSRPGKPNTIGKKTGPSLSVLSERYVRQAHECCVQ